MVKESTTGMLVCANKELSEKSNAWHCCMLNGRNLKETESNSIQLNGIFCDNNDSKIYSGCTTGAIRLAGSGSSSTNGRVELCYNNQWGNCL